MYMFTGSENWVDHLVGLGEERDIEGLVRQVFDGQFVAKKLEAKEWLSFVAAPVGSDAPIATLRVRCVAGKHLLRYLREKAREIMGFPQETTYYINSADIIMDKLDGQARTWKEETKYKKRRQQAQEQFASNTEDAVEATGRSIKEINKQMSKGIWDLTAKLQKDSTLIKENMTKLLQGVAYMVGMGNGQRPQAYVAATQADLYTLAWVKPKVQ